MGETKIVKVQKCIANPGCVFYRPWDGGTCITWPEMDSATNECLSNTDDWQYIIRECDIVVDEIESSEGYVQRDGQYGGQ